MTFESNALVKTPKEKPLQYGQPQRIVYLNASSILSIGNLTNFRFSDIGILDDAMKSCSPMNISDGNINGRRTIVWTNCLGLSV